MPHVSGGAAQPAPDDDAAAFEEGLAARGEAAPADEEGDLPPGATHETTETDDGERTVHRRRFSAS
jgi:hypothetical protein